MLRSIAEGDPDLDPVQCSQVDPAVKQYPDETSVQHVLAGVSEAEPFPDVGPAISALQEAGIKACPLPMSYKQLWGQGWGYGYGHGQCLGTTLLSRHAATLV